MYTLNIVCCVYFTFSIYVLEFLDESMWNRRVFLKGKSFTFYIPIWKIKYNSQEGDESN